MGYVQVLACTLHITIIEGTTLVWSSPSDSESLEIGRLVGMQNTQNNAFINPSYVFTSTDDLMLHQKTDYEKFSSLFNILTICLLSTVGT